MKTITAFVFIVLFFPGLFAQKRINTDSIKNLIKTSKTDSSKINLYFTLTSEYIQDDIDSAKYFLKMGKSLIGKTNAHQYDYDYYFSGLKICHATQEFDKALKYNLKALKTAEQNNNDFQRAEALRSLFVIYLNLKKDTLAVRTAQSAIKLTEKIKDTANLSVAYGNLSRLYFEIGNFQKSIIYGKKGIDAGKRYNNLKGLAISINNTAVSYQELGNIKQAESLFLELLKISEKNNLARSKVKALVNLINNGVYTGNKTKLHYYLNQLQFFIKKNPNAPFAKSDLSRLNEYIAYDYLYSDKFDEAEKEANKGLELTKNDNERQQILFKLICLINFAKHNYAKGKEYQLKSDSIQVILDKEDLSDFEANLDKKYQTEKKENQIQLQQAQIKNKNILNYIAFGSVIGLLTILFLTYRNYSHRKKLQLQRITELETEKQLLATQSLLKGQEEERSRLAKDLHDGLGGLLSGVKLQLGSMKGNLILSEENKITFDRALLKLDESISEMRRVAHNMMPESLVRTGLKQAILEYCDSLSQNQKFKINCELHGIDEKMSNATEVILYRIIQELVNNAVKHAEATQILVQVLRDENHNIFITIEDNGKGMEQNKEIILKSPGMQSLLSRVNYLKGTMDIKSEPKKGTSIYIECKEEHDG